MTPSEYLAWLLTQRAFIRRRQAALLGELMQLEREAQEIEASIKAQGGPR